MSLYLERCTFQQLSAVATTPQEQPGCIKIFTVKPGVDIVAKYTFAYGDLEGNTFDAGEPGFLMALNSSYTTHAKNAQYYPQHERFYIVTNQHDQTGSLGLYYCTGLAYTAIPEGYWGWFVLWGPMDDVLCDTGTAGFDAANVSFIAANNGTSGAFIQAGTAGNTNVIGLATTIHDGSNKVDVRLSVPIWR